MPAILQTLPEIVRAMLEKRPDAIIAIGGDAVRAARRMTSTVPIVIFGGPNPVDAGYAASLARPGGNVTVSSFWGRSSMASG